jgi:hypothetical protein
MRRIHSFEFTDKEWFPQVFRSSALAFLETMYRLSREASQLFARKLLDVMQETNTFEITDMASGATGPILHITKELRLLRGEETKVTMTDKFPAQSGMEKVAALHDPMIKYLPHSVDATNVPKELSGIRTIFGAFHHFTPDLARKVLRDAFEQRRSIAIFEIAARKAPLLLSGLFMPLMVLFITPLIRPLRWSQLLFTYLIPILPFLIAWDGIISVLRTYTPDELREMTKDLQSADYRWEIGELAVKGVPVKVPYIIGVAGQ